MKIRNLSLDRYGVWRDVAIPFGDPGLHVLHGPNEAGKSTLMRFVRGVFYGFDRRTSAAGRPGRDRNESTSDSAAGSMTVEAEGERWLLTRSLSSEARRSDDPLSDRGELDIRGADASSRSRMPAGDWLAQSLGGISESVYQRIFAVGLEELQQLGTLQADEVARQIYGASLGPDGQRLLGAFERLDAESAKLSSADGRGLLQQLAERENALRTELARFASDRDRYDDLHREREELEAQIIQWKAKQGDSERQLRGFDLLQKAWEPWQQVEGLRRELKSLPRTRKFPERGVERLRGIDAELADLSKRRDAARNEYRRLRARFGEMPKDAAADYRPRVQSLADQREWLTAGLARITQADSREASLKKELEKRLAELGSGWTLARIEALDASPERYQQLAATAQRRQRAALSRNRLQKRLKGWSRSCRAQAADVAERLKQLDAPSLDRSLSDARTRVTDLHEYSELRRKEFDHESRGIEVRDNLRTLDAKLVYPEWLPMLLWFFAIGGAAAAVLGFYQGFQQNGLAGLMWAFLGLTCGGLAWAVKSHYEVAVQETAEPLHARRQRVDADLQQIEQQIDKLHRRSPWLKTAFAARRAGDTSTPWDDELKSTKERFAELERLAGIQQRVLARRQKLSGLRQRFQQAHRDVTATRQQWCQLLKDLGLPESLRTQDGMVAWQRVLEARAKWLEWRMVSEPAQDHRTAVQSFQSRLHETGRLLEVKLPQGRSPLEQLAFLEERVGSLPQPEGERKGAAQEVRRHYREWRTLSAQVRKLRRERTALLREAGARSKREFERKSAAFHRRGELQELLAVAESELQSVGADEIELAIVEDDLRAFNPDRHRERRAALLKEREVTDRGLQTAYERIGSLKQELKAMEADRRASDLRVALAQVESERAEAEERWCGLQAAGDALVELRGQYEKTCQPATLAAASEWLGQLTQGRYRSVWTPLGDRDLRVDDGQGRTWRVEQLSSGTREQLFLAVRLALVRQLRDQGIDLPMVLDDVLVNFDQERTEAALETLRKFAAQGQQILLFTCHRHVAELGQSLGCESIRLPSRATEAEDPSARREERRAG
jgi:uncharacterized protein YhaN